MATTAEAPPVKLHWCDEQAMPEWGTGPDGRQTLIGSDERFIALFAEWKADYCHHEHALIVQQNDSLNRPQYFSRCEHCGLRLSSAISHAAANGNTSDKTADEMDTLAQNYVQQRRARLDQLTRDAAERCQPANRQSHEDYLRSDAWRRRADKILARAGGICEGCLTNKATQVHHLTYENFGQEFAFELLAVCDPCHNRIHKRTA